MPIFQYKGYKPDGSFTSGTVEADGLHDAISSVKASGIYPKDISEHSQKERRWFSRGSDTALLPYITRQLSTLLSAGVPLIDALRSLSEESTGVWKNMLVGIRERVSAGSNLSRALEEHPSVFPDFYINMVSAGEQSGRLDMVLSRISDFLEKQAAIRGKIQAAMVYPAFMVFVGFGVMSFLFTFVVPKIVKIFENSKSALPFVTIVLIFLSNIFVKYWWAITILAIGLVLGLRWVREKHGPWLDSLKLKVPGGLMQNLYFGRFSRTLGFLLEGGLPMIKSMELSAKSVGNSILQDKIMLAAKKVVEGARLSSSLEGFPSILVQLIATGEKSGTLGDMLNKAADSYEVEFERKVQKALALLEPVMILLMGFAVGFIVLAVLLPMFQMNQLVK